MKLASTLLFVSMFVVGFTDAGYCQPAADGKIPTAVEEKLGKFRTDLMQFFAARDLDKIASLCEPDCVITWQDGTRVVGPEELKKYYNEKMTGPNSPVDKIEFNPKIASRKIEGTTVISHGRMNDVFYLKRFAKPLPFNSVYTAVLVDTGTEFKLRTAHLSVDAFDNAILDAEKLKTKLYVGGIGAVTLLLGFLLGRKKKA